MLYNFLMILSRLIRFLPFGFVLFLGKILGNIFYLVAKKQRERAINQMMPALGMSRDESEKIARKSFINLTRNMLEILYMPNLNAKNVDEYVEIDELERNRIKDALAENHGVVVATAHIGTWEWMSASLALLGFPITAIAKIQPNVQYTRALDDLRAKVNVVIFNRGTSELLAAGRALKAGKVLGFLMDQDAGPGGAFINFLGKPASTPLGPAVFARKFHSPILPLFIIRKDNGRHKIISREIMHFESSGDNEKDLLDITTKLNQIIESVIRENPTQWIWYQKRWNTPVDMAKTGKHHQ